MQFCIPYGGKPTGLPLVEQALIRGHQVKTLLFDPNNFPIYGERLAMLRVDQPDATQWAVAGVDAVLLPLETDLAMRTALIQAMRGAGVSRLMAITNQADMMPWITSLRHTDLDWTAVMATYITDGPPTGIYTVRNDAPDAPSKPISRYDLADWMILNVHNTARSGYKIVVLSG
jgi:putative NADH-flavin reductase